MPTMLTRTLAENASTAVSRKRESTSSSATTRGNALKISDGIGTMKRLITPMRMKISTRRMTAANEPNPSTKGNQRDLLMAIDAMRASLRMSPAPVQRLRLVLRQAAGRLFAQIAPDLRHVAAKRLARHDLGCARPRQVNIDDAFHLARPIGHHHDAIGELHGLSNIVSDQQGGLLQLLLNLQHLVAQQEPGLLVKRRERLVHQHDLRLGRERARHRYALAHAARKLGRVAPLKSVETDQSDEMPGAVVALPLGQPGELEREGDIVDHRAPGEG